MEAIPYENYPPANTRIASTFWTGLIWQCFEQLSQTARGFHGTYDCLMTKEKILKKLERVKWFLWHGNVFRADETLTDLMFEMDGTIEEDRGAR
jgi:hypothetical protein